MLEISSSGETSVMGSKEDPQIASRVAQLEKLKAAQASLKQTLEKDFKDARIDMRDAEGLIKGLSTELEHQMKDDSRSTAAVLLDKLLASGVENAGLINELVYTNHQVSDLDIRSFFANAQKPQALASESLSLS